MATAPGKPTLDSVTTINDDGSRRFIHPATVSGRFTRARALVGLLIMAVYGLLPWIPINGHPAVFLDVTQRHPGIHVAQAEQPLVRYHVGAGSVSTAIRSGQSVAWAREHLAGRSARARGDFLMTVPVHYARRERSVRRAISAIAAGFSLGRPSWRASAYAGASLGLISLDLSLGWFRRLRRAPN